MKESYEITGMSCSACSARIERCVGKLEGIENVSVNLLTNQMQIAYDEKKLNVQKIVETIEKAGYGASLIRERKREDSKIEKDSVDLYQKEQKSKTYSFWISLCFLIPMMYISMHHMFYEWFGLPIPSWVQNLFHGEKNAIAFSFTQFLLVLPILYVNQHYFINGFRNLLQRSPNMDSLVALGSSAAVIYGVFAIYQIGYGLGNENLALVGQYSEDLYFESAGMILTLITLGKLLESKSKGKTKEAIERLINLAPKTATVERNGKEIEIPTEEIVVGDIVVIRPGESIAVDGRILEGSTSIDESAMTGESIPVEKQAGDSVISATINQKGFIKIQAGKVGEDTTIQQMIRLVDAASASKAPIAKMADKVAGIFVPVVIGIAVVAMLIWLAVGASFTFALSIGISILVISCPCALGLATPVAIMVGTGKGAENGILIKSGEALEIAHRVDTVVMDKTGTITEGKPRVTEVLAFTTTDEKLLSIAAGLEKGSEHPLADAVLEYTEQKNISQEIMEQHEAVFGRGLTAKQGNIHFYTGNQAFMEEKNISIHPYQEQINALAKQGKTPLLFAKEEQLLGCIAVADVEKETSKRAIEQFTKMKIDVVMLTGDNKQTAKAISERLHIPKVIAEVLPEEKEKEIVRLQKEGHTVAMIGDGVNDAPALARADIGIAIGAGTDIAIESADAVLMQDNLLDAVTSIKLSKAVIRNIKENLFWAFFYNVIGIPLAAGVWYPVFGIKLNPMFGAAAMSFSSVFVVCNALRLRFFQKIS